MRIPPGPGGRATGRPVRGLLAVAAAVVLLAPGAGGAGAAAAAHVRRFALPGSPLGVAVGRTAVWVTVAGAAHGGLLRVDPVSGRITHATVLGAQPTGVAATAGAIWVVTAPGDTRNREPGQSTLFRVDPGTGAVEARIGLRDPEEVVAGAGAVWVSSPGPPATVTRIDPADGRVVARIALRGAGPTKLAAGAGAVWALSPLIRSGEQGRLVVSRIDPGADRVTAARRVSGSAGAIAVGRASVWLATDGVVAVDPHTLRPLGPVVTARAGNLAVGLGSVWSTQAGGRVRRRDLRTGKAVGAAIEVGRSADRIAVGDGAVWVTDSVGDTLVRIDA